MDQLYKSMSYILDRMAMIDRHECVAKPLKKYHDSVAGDEQSQRH